MPAPEIIHQLVARFSENRESYRSGKYNEAQLRQEFLDPFFEALGWDVYNKHGYAPDYRDVVIEDSLEVEGTSKAPDYAFKIGKERKFYAEAKKPAVDIKYDVHPAYQLRRYAWNGHMALSVLTDFEEFAVYNCKDKPNPTDSAATGRDKFYHFTEYVEKWDEIAEIFSRDAVWKGSFDRFAQTSRGKKGTTEVDDAFLKDIEEWRTLLARNIALRNPDIRDERPLNYAVQMTIDRIIFLRICEDRGIEPDEQLKELTKAVNIYHRLVDLFKRADARYNSGLFHFSLEKGQSTGPDSFTPALHIDDKVLKDIIHSIYYPCPYIFKEIPVEILGQVYEQFLGKVIRLTPGHQAKVEEKPEVRKAGGVYYTPRYIVDYIVQQTVGKLLEGKTPIEAAALKIVDPACGSGSFLLGAYRHLLDWHQQWYLEHEPEKWAKGRNPALMQSSSGGWRMTTEKKKEILVNNIHGVDIDPQAVEVTKLSLLLKVLEEESGQMSFVQERVLPDLGKNIQCGNSLIGEDYFAGRLVVEESERERVNPFDWQRSFPQVFKQGGFDAVIGNPPYFSIDDNWEKTDPLRLAIKSLYQHIYTDKTDILFYFVARAIQISKNYVCFIISRAFLEAFKADKLRVYLINNCKINNIIDFQNYYIFANVGISTCILNVTKNGEPEVFSVYKLKEDHKYINHLNSTTLISNIFERIEVVQNSLNSLPWNFTSSLFAKINNKIDSVGIPLGDLVLIGKGMETGLNSVFGKKLISEITEWGLLPGQFFKRASNSDIQRYKIRDRGEYLIYPQPFKDLKDLPDGLRKYLSANSQNLKKRAAYVRGDCEWWKYTWPLHEKLYTRVKILTPYLSESNRFAIDENKEFLGLTDTTVIFDRNQNESMYYILGLLNSKLLSFRFKSIGKLKGAGIYEYFWNSISKLSIRTINFQNHDEVAMHDRIVTLVNRIITLIKIETVTPQEAEKHAREIEATDREIDRLVYELYGLTDEEIRLVEGE